MNFLGIGPLEIIIILILAFLFIGPKKLPGMAAKAGNLYRNFRKATFDLTKTITDDMSSEKDLREDLKSIGKSLTEDFSQGRDTEYKRTHLEIPESDKKWIEESAGNTPSTVNTAKKKTRRKKAVKKLPEPQPDPESEPEPNSDEDMI
jgi:Sec-independent protein translocase protein TatA